MSPRELYEENKKELLLGLKKIFPIKGQKHILEAERIWVEDENFDWDNYPKERDIKISGKTLGVPVYADLILKDTQGKILDRQKKQKLMDLPVVTNRLSYLIQGVEYQLTNQLRLKPGVYTNFNSAGQVQANYNVGGGRNFNLILDPQSNMFQICVGQAHFGLYPLLKILGVKDSDIEKAWGKELLNINKRNINPKDMINLYQRIFEKEYPGDKAAEKDFKTYFSNLTLGETTKLTLGKTYNRVDPRVLIETSKKMLNISKGKESGDDKDAMPFREFYTQSELIGDVYKRRANQLNKRISWDVDKKNRIKEIYNLKRVKSPLLQLMITDETGSSSGLGAVPEQINPLEMVEGLRKTTVFGEKGVSSEHAIPIDARNFNPSQLGFIDIIDTPECYDELTQVFTKDGWKFWKDITKKDLLACNINGYLEFNYPQKLYKKHYNGVMYGVKKGYSEYLVTPNHDIYYAGYYTWRKRKKEDRVNLFRKGKAEDIYLKHLILQKGHQPYIPKNPIKEFKLPIIPGSNDEKDVVHIDIDIWAGFLGLFLSENNNLLQFDKSYEKFIPEYIFEMPIEIRKRFLNAFLLRNSKTRYKKRYERIYITNNVRLANDIERLAIGLGYAVSHRIKKTKGHFLPIHTVRLLKFSHSQINRKHHYKKQYSGMVYCATVPGGLLYVRRNNGHGIWSGNSGRVGLTGHLSKSFDMKTKTMVVKDLSGKEKRLTPEEAYMSIIGFSDDLELAKKEKRNIVRGIYKGQLGLYDKHKIKYVIEPQDMMDYSTNLIPFVDSTSGGRALLGAKMLRQALPLKEREAPMVQVLDKDDTTFEEKVIDQFLAKSPVKGVVKRVDKEYITIEGVDKEKYKVPLYKNYPLNSNTFLEHEVKVKAGDKVNKGDILADTNYSKDGKLALGTHLLTGYIPHRYTYEDGIVISDEAAKKLTSQHLHKKSISISREDVLDLNKFEQMFPGTLTAEQSKKLDISGVIKVGETVKIGDPLIAYLSYRPPTPEDAFMKNLNKALAQPYNKEVIYWEGEDSGVVTDVRRTTDNITIYIRTEEPAKQGDKLAARHGGKGVITAILPSAQMPKLKNGKPLEVIISPLAIPTRQNPSQLMSGMVSKIGHKIKQFIQIGNFTPESNIENIKKSMKQAKVKDKEELFDEQGKPIGSALVVPNYILKLDSPARKRYSDRYQSAYTTDRIPAKAKGESAQTVDILSYYSMLGHGTPTILHETATFKNEYNPEVWRNIQLGEPPPAPRPTFAYNRFEAMLKGLGVNIKKRGSSMQLTPIRDKEVLSMSRGEIKKPDILRAKDLKEIPGGLYDPTITQGVDGSGWGHVHLQEPLPNPLTQRAIMSLLNLNQKQYKDLITGELKVDSKTGKIVQNEKTKG